MSSTSTPTNYMLKIKNNKYPIGILVSLILGIILFNHFTDKYNKENEIKHKEKIKKLDGGSEDIETIYKKYYDSYNAKYAKVRNDFATAKLAASFTKTTLDDTIVRNQMDDALIRSLNDKELIVHDLKNTQNMETGVNILLVIFIICDMAYIYSN